MVLSMVVNRLVSEWIYFSGILGRLVPVIFIVTSGDLQPGMFQTQWDPFSQTLLITPLLPPVLFSIIT